MSEISIAVDDAVAQMFPGTVLGVMRIHGAHNDVVGDPLGSARIRALSDIQEKYSGWPAQSIEPVGAWRDAYRLFGTSHKKATPTLEALVRRALTKGELPHISPLVDAYLITELEHLVPFGGYDATKISGKISLRRSPGEEEFVKVGSEDPEFTQSGEFVYVDDVRVLTRHWNYRDSDVTKITAHTSESIIVCEILKVGGVSEPEQILETLDHHVRSSTGATTSVELIHL